MIDRVATKGDRSRLIDEAVRHFVRGRRLRDLRARLKEGAQKRAERDLHLAEEWFLLEEEPWLSRKE
jgi:CopG family transcriptional regulator/antitoxin EndoAI